MQAAFANRQTFAFAHLCVGTLIQVNAAGYRQRGANDLIAPMLGAGGEKLNDQLIGVTVNDQPRQLVGFAKHQAQRVTACL